MIVHPVTGNKVPPRAFAKYALRNAIEDLLRPGPDGRERWQGDLTASAGMTERERKLVNTQLEHMLQSMIYRHNLHKDRSEN